MVGNLSVLISSCDKFSDLWNENINAYRKHWKNNKCETFLVTDKNSNWSKKGITLVVAEGQNDFPLRIKHALNQIKTQYVLVTLDDYFLIDDVSNDKLSYLVKRMEKEKIQYLSLYNRRITKKSKYQPIENLNNIDLQKKYALNLYPAIWDVDFLKRTIKDNMSPWLYELSLTKTALEEDAKCMASLAGTFDILDVVRKGKVLHKAQRYFKKNNINIGNRSSISYFTEIKLFILDVISWYTPRWLFKIIKKLARKCGMTFYSED